MVCGNRLACGLTGLVGDAVFLGHRRTLRARSAPIRCRPAHIQVGACRCDGLSNAAHAELRIEVAARRFDRTQWSS